MKLKTDATKMLTALTPVLCKLESTKDDAGFKKVPKQLQSKFLATLKSLQEMRDGCQDAIAKRTTAAITPCRDNSEFDMRAGRTNAEWRDMYSDLCAVCKSMDALFCYLTESALKTAPWDPPLHLRLEGVDSAS